MHLLQQAGSAQPCLDEHTCWGDVLAPSTAAAYANKAHSVCMPIVFAAVLPTHLFRTPAQLCLHVPCLRPVALRPCCNIMLSCTWLLCLAVLCHAVLHPLLSWTLFLPCCPALYCPAPFSSGLARPASSCTCAGDVLHVDKEYYLSTYTSSAPMLRRSAPLLLCLDAVHPVADQAQSTPGSAQPLLSCICATAACRYIDKDYYLNTHRSSAPMAAFKQRLEAANWSMDITGQGYNELNIGFMQ